MSDEGRLVAGRYRVQRRIGSGAMGVVWECVDERLHRTVAVKQLLLQPGLDPGEAEEARQRAMREGRIAARLQHPNAISVYDVAEDEGQPVLVMEYLPSTSLAAMMAEHGPLPPREVARIGAQVASALGAAHSAGVVHRDIKPGNILLDRDGMVKITDFGISRATDDVTVTKTGMIAGTPAYLAPEVAIGQTPGPESDIFSLGSTLYAATEGQPPFGLSENTLGLLHAVAAGQINPPRRSGPLTSVLAVLLHPEKERRPDAEEAERLLSAVARGETPLGGPVESDPTAMVAAGAVAGAGAMAGNLSDEDYQDYDEYDEYDDYPAESDDYTRPMGYADRTAALRPAEEEPLPPEEDEEPRRGGWLKSAAAAALVVGGVTAAALYLTSGEEAPAGNTSTQTTTSSSARPAKQATTTSQETTTTTTTTTTNNWEPPPDDFTTEPPEPEDEPSAEPEEPEIPPSSAPTSEPEDPTSDPDGPPDTTTEDPPPSSEVSDG